jgi:signal peptidase I
LTIAHALLYDKFMSNELRAAGIAEPPPAETKRERISTPRSSKRDEAGNSPATETATETLGPPKSVFREYFESAVVTIIMALFGMTFIVQAVKVPTGSMQNTITVGDQLLVNKFVFAPGPTAPFLPQTTIGRGDVIVFKYPGNQYNPALDAGNPTNTPYINNFVKRVIGLPGDRVEVRGARVYVNGELLPEHRITARESDDVPPQLREVAPLEVVENPPRASNESYSVYYTAESTDGVDEEAESRNVGFHYAVSGSPITVPPNHYFVMGDNRNNSADGRDWGVVPRELIVGRAMFVYWSYDMSAPQNPTPIVGRVIDFFSNTRWSRTGTLIR